MILQFASDIVCAGAAAGDTGLLATVSEPLGATLGETEGGSAGDHDRERQPCDMCLPAPTHITRVQIVSLSASPYASDAFAAIIQSLILLILPVHANR